MLSRISRLAPVFSVAAAFTYSSWVLGPAINPSLPTLTSFASELASPSQPGHLFFRIGDALTALLVLVVAALLASSLGSRLLPRWLGRVLLLGAVAFSVATFVDVLFPMTCADSLTSPDVLRTAACQTMSLRMHEAASVTVGAVSVGACLLSIWWLYRVSRGSVWHEDVASVPAVFAGFVGGGQVLSQGFVSGLVRGRFGVFTSLTVVFACAHVFFSGLTSVTALVDWLPGLGVFQRLAILSLSLWWVVFTWILSTGSKVFPSPTKARHR